MPIREIRHNAISRRHVAILLLSGCLLLGFWLRVHTLGRDGFRLDEAGQALAATQPTLAGMIEVEQTHAMALPLDYLVTRIAATIGETEFVMRFGSAIWGTVAIAIIYSLTSYLSRSNFTALLSAFILALSPVHIYYSQELRFYAALSAFFLLSVLTLFRAVRQTKIDRWIAFLLATLIGAYFHPFVLLSVVIGAVYYLLAILTDTWSKAALFRFMLSTAIIALTFLPGYLVFGAHQQYEFDLLQWSGTLPKVILGGLDWTETFGTAEGPLMSAWLYLNLGFAVLGLLFILFINDKTRRWWMLISFILGAIAGIGLITLAVIARGYWLLPRQLVHLSQVGIILTAMGISGIVHGPDRPPSSKSWRSMLRLAVLGSIILFISIAAGDKLHRYYNEPRQTGREAAYELLDVNQGNELIFIIPGYEWQSLAYYLEQDERGAGIIMNLRPLTLEELSANPQNDQPAFLFFRSTGSKEEEIALLEEMGFMALNEYQLAPNRRYMLFFRESTD